MFSRKAIGVSCNSAGAAFVQISGKASAPCLKKTSYASFSPDTVSFSPRERNIVDEGRFRETLRKAHESLACKSDGIFLALPDTVGHVMLLEMNESFRNRSEAIDILKWKLKKKFNLDISELHLDYQHLRTRDDGFKVLLVALVSRSVMQQHEESMTAIGAPLAGIDLKVFSNYRLFERRFPPDDDYALISCSQESLGILFFSKNVLEFLRIRKHSSNEPDISRLHREIKYSLLAYRERFPERTIKSVYCIPSPQSTEALLTIIREVLEIEPLLMDAQSAISTANGIAADRNALFPYISAIGAAIRGI